MHYYELDPIRRPLLDKFYKDQRSSMRSSGTGRCWVAKDRQIVAGLNLTPVESGHWLTGLHVARDRRGQGIARHLIQTAHDTCAGPLWLFCEPALLGFYMRLDFTEATTLPALLDQRLTRYRQTKALLALVRQPVSHRAVSAG